MFKDEYYEVDETDCCGNGCANCILETKQIHKNTLSANENKKNILLKYRKYKLISKRPYDLNLQDVLDLHFKYSDVSKAADLVLGITPGNHIMMRAPLCSSAESGRSFITRPYSPYWIQRTDLEFKILVNLKPNGLMSKYIATFIEGDEIEFRGPVGCFEHRVDSKGQKSIIMVTQGVAIAPTLPVIEEILNNDDDMSRIYHLSCFRNIEEIFFRDRFMEFNKYWNFKGWIYVAHEKCCSDVCTQRGSCTDQCVNFRSHVKYKEQLFPHRLDSRYFADFCNGISDTNEKIIILCGTRNFQDYFLNSVNNMVLNVKKENIFLF